MLQRLSATYRPAARYDVCVVGAGAAGITLALALADLGKSVFLAEGGLLEQTDESQDIYAGRAFGDPFYPHHESRLRYLGGTTGHWGGICRPFDDWDFEARTALPDAQWPISRKDLAPYLKPAASILGIAPFEADQPIAGTSAFVDQHWIASTPIRFGTRFAPDLSKTPAIDAVYGCSLVRTELVGTRISMAHFEGFDGAKCSIAADQFVIASGGIENARILMLQSQQHRGAFGSTARALGHYFMDHPRYQLGQVIITNAARLTPRKGAAEIYWNTTRAFQNLNKVLGACVSIVPHERPVTQVLKDTICDANQLRLLTETLLGRQMACQAGHVMIQSEMAPSHANSLSLDPQHRDRFNQPRIVSNLRKTRLDRRTVSAALMMAQTLVAKLDVARMRLDPWVTDFALPIDDAHWSSMHFMGGTRMGTDPLKAVVDGHGRLFGLENAFVAGSSVFPTGAVANPTFTIVQLALRMADHLAGLKRA